MKKKENDYEKYRFLVHKCMERLEIINNDTEYKLKDALYLLNESLSKRKINDFPFIKNLYSWKDLYSYLNLVEGFKKESNIENESVKMKSSFLSKDKKSKDKKENIETEFFKSKEEQFIYYLTRLDGVVQREKLGIKPLHYAKKEYAKKMEERYFKRGSSR